MNLGLAIQLECHSTVAGPICGEKGTYEDARKIDAEEQEG